MKRSLGLLAFGYVEHHALPEAWSTVLVPHQHGLVPNPCDPTVAGDLTVLHPERLTGLVCAPIFGQNPFTIFGMQQVNPEFRVFHEGLRWITRLRLYLRAGVQSRVGPARTRFGRLLSIRYSRDLLDQRAKLLLASSQRLFGALMLPPLLGFAYSTLYGRHKPLQAILEHIIRGTILQSLDSHLFTQRARHENERHLGTDLPRYR